LVAQQPLERPVAKHVLQGRDERPASRSRPDSLGSHEAAVCIMVGLSMLVVKGSHNSHPFTCLYTPHLD
jgi:hypothetical protein